MTPVEKASKLVNKYIFLGNAVNSIGFAKQSALIAVDEIISEIEPSVSMDVIETRIKYWEEVKQEIEKL